MFEQRRKVSNLQNKIIIIDEIEAGSELEKDMAEMSASIDVVYELMSCSTLSVNISLSHVRPNCKQCERANKMVVQKEDWSTIRL